MAFIDAISVLARPFVDFGSHKLSDLRVRVHLAVGPLQFFNEQFGFHFPVAEGEGRAG